MEGFNSWSEFLTIKVMADVATAAGYASWSEFITAKMLEAAKAKGFERWGDIKQERVVDGPQQGDVRESDLQHEPGPDPSFLGYRDRCDALYDSRRARFVGRGDAAARALRRLGVKQQQERHGDVSAALVKCTWWFDG